MSKVYKRDAMANVNHRMYEYTMSLARKASKNGDSDGARKLEQEAWEHNQVANHHELMLQVCGNEFIYG